MDLSMIGSKLVEKKLTLVATMLKECLNEATTSIKDAINNAQSIVNSQNSGSLADATTNSETASNNLTFDQNATPSSSAGNGVQKP